MTQVEKSGQQLMCKETFKDDGMAGVGGSAAKNSSTTKANKINSNSFPVVSCQNAYQAIARDQYDDITEIDKS